MLGECISIAGLCDGLCSLTMGNSLFLNSIDRVVSIDISLPGFGLRLWEILCTVKSSFLFVSYLPSSRLLHKLYF